MLIPKASHLVERAAERLLKSGALDESAAQLMQPGTRQADADRAPAPSRSSLFAPPPPPPAPPVAQVPPTPIQSTPIQSTPIQSTPIQSTPIQPAPVPAATIQPPPAPVADARERDLDEPGNTAVLERPEPAPSAPVLPNNPAFATAAPAYVGKAADPAAMALQGPLSIDALSLERAGMVDWSRTRTRISEEFRLVQRQILRSAFGPGAEPGFSNLLLVTSARPGEGKSFMSTNLAGSIARQGDHHVLLIDSDSKRDSICYSFGLAQARGLLDLAANPKLDPAPLIVKTPIERLSILPVGRERERSAELFSTKEMTRIIQSLGRRYADRLLILDAPPCLSTSDPAVLAQVVGQILFVVEADRTQRDEIEASLDLIQACPSITLVLNKQQISSRYTFGAYSSYYSS
jgi:receptor protein-tyrosine kinase